MRTSAGTDVGAGSLLRLLSWGLFFCKNRRPIELLENALRCLGRGTSLVEIFDDAAVDTEALELVEYVLSRQPKDASDDDDDDTVDITLSRLDFGPYTEALDLGR